MTYLRLVREHQEGEQKFLAAIHGVELTTAGSASAAGGIRGFNERIKRKLMGR